MFWTKTLHTHMFTTFVHNCSWTRQIKFAQSASNFPCYIRFCFFFPFNFISKWFSFIVFDQINISKCIYIDIYFASWNLRTLFKIGMYKCVYSIFNCVLFCFGSQNYERKKKKKKSMIIDTHHQILKWF